MATKIYFVIAVVVSLTLIGASIYGINKFNEYKAEISTLDTANAKLVAENVALQKAANLKSFANTKELERFLKDAKSIAEYKNDYASVSCINLMREAKEKGYWLGIMAVNTSDENYFKAMLRERNGTGKDVTWHVFNVAVIGDGDLYLVDTQDASYLFVMTIRGDFADYYKSVELNADTLKLH
jgi:hypothetical protein